MEEGVIRAVRSHHSVDRVTHEEYELPDLSKSQVSFPGRRITTGCHSIIRVHNAVDQGVDEWDEDDVPTGNEFESDVRC